MQKTLCTAILAFTLVLSLIPIPAGAEGDGEWQQIPTVPADCSVVMSEGLELTEVRAFYQGDPKTVEEGTLDGMWLEYTVTGPARVRDVCRAAVMNGKPSRAEAEKAASESTAGKEIAPQTLPIRGIEPLAFTPGEQGKTLYCVLAGLDENSALAGWAVVEFTVGESEDLGEISWGGRWEGDTAIYWTCSADRKGQTAQLFLEGDISEDAPAFAAVYNEAGQMLSVHLLTRPGGVTITDGKTARVFWLYGGVLAPRTERMQIPLDKFIK